jgi:two-component system, NarL family, response regulator YdfI
MNDEIIRVAILSPALAVRLGLRALLEQDSGIEVVIESSDFIALENRPQEIDVIILAPGANSLGDWSKVDDGSNPDLPLLFLTDEARDLQMVANLPVPVWGALSLDASEDELSIAIRALHLGMTIVPPELLAPVFSSYAISADADLVEALTPRESEVLELVAQGLANKQIARELDISEHTVKFHISAIYRKLGVTNRTEAVRTGMRLGLVLL